MIRDESIRVLAEAEVRSTNAHEHSQLCPVWVDRAKKPDPMEVCDCWVKDDAPHHSEERLVASPTLARRLDLGTAWDDAVAALPEGWLLQSGMTVYLDRPFSAIAHRADWRPVGLVDLSVHPDDCVEQYADSPEDALVALTAALRERQP